MCLNPLQITVTDDLGRRIVRNVRCGKCVECKMQYTSDWSYRVMLEAQKYKDNCFLTLTYNEANLPSGASLRKRDLQLFFKRLRKQLSADAIKIRYFACGEYGAKHERPHYHVIIFGYNFSDKYFFGTDNKGNNLYRSPFLEKVWTSGFSSIGELTFETAKYCAKYLAVDKDFMPAGKEPSFTLMSRRPGIALDVIPKSVYTDGVLYYEGKRVRAPRAFLNVVKKEFPEVYKIIEYKRLPFSECVKLQYFDQDFYDAHYHRISKNMPSDIRYLWENYNSELWNKCWHDKSLEELYQAALIQEQEQRYSDLQVRREKIKKIFGRTIDKCFRVVVKLKKKL